MRILGVLVIVLGVVLLVYGGITWTERDKVADIGPVEITKTDHNRLPVPPIVGGLILAAGVGMLLVKRRPA